MGEWAERMLVKFRTQASAERRADELELQRHSKTQAGAEKSWKKLGKYMGHEVKDFNRLMQREFLTVFEHANTLEVVGPELRLVATLDLRVPEIDFEYKDLFPNNEVTDSGELKFRLAGEDVAILDEYGDTTSIEAAGGKLLEPLIPLS